MLNDKPRNVWFENRITESCKDKVVLEVGGGSGLLTYYALKAGAKHVYVVERDITIIPILRGVLDKCFDSSQYTIIQGEFNSDQVESEIPLNSIDVFISETLGGAGIDEGLLTTWWCAQKFCKKDCVFIPETVSIDIYYWDTWGFTGDTPDKVKHLNEDSLPSEFLDALLTTDSENIRLYEWRDVSNYLDKETHLCKPVKLDTISWSYNNLPEFRFDLPYPAHVFPQIEFALELEKGLLAFIPKMNSDYLYKFQHQAWRQAPFYYVPATGTYRITYKDLGQDDNNLQWVIQRVV